MTCRANAQKDRTVTTATPPTRCRGESGWDSQEEKAVASFRPTVCTHSVSKVVLQKSTPPQIRQLILPYYYQSKD